MATEGYVPETTTWLTQQKDKMQRVFMIRNFENTERWEDKAGNTQKLGNSKLASPLPFIFTPHFSAFTINKLQKFTPLKVSHFPLW